MRSAIYDENAYMPLEVAAKMCSTFRPPVLAMVVMGDLNEIEAERAEPSRLYEEIVRNMGASPLHSSRSTTLQLAPNFN